MICNSFLPRLRPRGRTFMLAAALLATLALAHVASPCNGAGVDEPGEPVIVTLADGSRASDWGVGPAISLPATVAGPGGGCAAPPPTLLKPISGEIVNDLYNPAYTWSGTPGISEYIFQIAKGDNFAAPLTTERRGGSAQGGQITHLSFYALARNTDYFWRVASVCAGGEIGAFSAPAGFRTGNGANQPCPLLPPPLVAPANGAQVDTLVPRLTWARVPNAREFILEYADNVYFRDHYTHNLFGIDPNASGNVWSSFSANLLPDQVYYWRVASGCAEYDSFGSYSPTYSFRTPPLGGPLLPPPELIAPEDGATTGSIRVVLLFSQVQGAEWYGLRIYTTLEAAQDGRYSTVYSGPGTTGIAVFNPKVTRYWRVNTRTAYGWGDLSPIRSFTTPAAEASATISPEYGGVLSTSPGYLTVSFPPGAVPGPTRLDFQLRATPGHPLPRLRFGNRSFTLAAFMGDELVTHFGKLYTMRVTYSSSDLVAAGIGDPRTLNLAYWDGSAWRMTLPCARCGVDPAHRTVTVMLDHLTEFALVARDDWQLRLPMLLR